MKGKVEGWSQEEKFETATLAIKGFLNSTLKVQLKKDIVVPLRCPIFKMVGVRQGLERFS